MWVPVRDAAAVLGLSEDTIKRRLKVGALAARKEPTARGFRWVVEVPDAAPAQPPQMGAPDSNGATAQGSSGEIAALRQHLAAVERELEHRNRELEARDRDVERLIILLQRAQGAVLPAGPIDRATAEPPHQRPHQPPLRRHPWWRVLLRRLAS